MQNNTISKDITKKTVAHRFSYKAKFAHYAINAMALLMVSLVISSVFHYEYFNILKQNPDLMLSVFSGDKHSDLHAINNILKHPLFSLFGIKIYTIKQMGQSIYNLGLGFLDISFDLWRTYTLIIVTAALSSAMHRYIGFLLSRKQEMLNVHGNAEWCTIEQLKHNDFFIEDKPENRKEATFFVGRLYNPKHLIHNKVSGTKIPKKNAEYVDFFCKNSHMMVFGTTGSGKNISLIVNNLLMAPGSIFVYDPKPENFLQSAAYLRSIGKKILMFNPTFNPKDYHTNALIQCAKAQGVIQNNHEATEDMLLYTRWNPMSRLNKNDPTFADSAKVIATALVEGDKQSDHWTENAALYIQMVMMYVVEKFPLVKANLSSVAILAVEAEHRAREAFVDNGKAMNTEIRGGKALVKLLQYSSNSTTVQGNAQSLYAKSDNEFAGILSTSTTVLSMYRLPTVEYNTCVSDFSFEDLQDHDSPVVMYFNIPAAGDKAKTYNGLFRLFLNQMTTVLQDHPRFQNTKSVAKHQLFAILDEFPQLGKLEGIEKSIAFARGAKIAFMIISQSENQIVKEYTQHHAFNSNCKVKVYFPPEDDQTAEAIITQLGNTTVHQATSSLSGELNDPLADKQSNSIQTYAVPLMTKDELKTQVKGSINGSPADMIVFGTGCNPILAKSRNYFMDPTTKRQSEMGGVYTLDRLNPEVADYRPVFRSDQETPETRKEIEAFSLCDYKIWYYQKINAVPVIDRSTLPADTLPSELASTLEAYQAYLEFHQHQPEFRNARLDELLTASTPPVPTPQPPEEIVVIDPTEEFNLAELLNTDDNNLF